MSNDADQTQNPIEAEAEAATQSKKERAVRRKPDLEAAKDEVLYVTVEKHSYPFDIMIKGHTILGHWSRRDGFVEFAVPKALVEGFEKHHHFMMGNVVAVA